ncbi:MAG: hypothetical protein M1358_11040 [Chloroflexi bacterium]|nr:hypothetical protein [Chloroflexota bacterium]
MLLFAILGWATTLPNTIHPNALQRLYPDAPRWYALWVMVSTGLHLATYVGIWRWMRLAVYTFLLLGAIQLVLIGTIAKPLYGTAMVAILVTWHVLWLWAIARTWRLFT